MTKIIVTDLTRFSKAEKVCIAGINTQTFECVRPMPYLTAKACKDLNILPGAILEANFKPFKETEKPHTEDHFYEKNELSFQGPCSAKDFKKVLAKTHVKGVGNGFSVKLKDDQKCIPSKDEPNCSITTIKVSPQNVYIVQDSYNPEKIRVHFKDDEGVSFRFISITDLGFYEYAERVYKKKGKLNDLNNFIHSQSEIYLRIGLSRAYKSDDGREGYWIQCNGIYTFPKFHENIRSYG